MASKNEEKWKANYEALKAYIDEHHHLPPKSATDGKWMLNFALCCTPHNAQLSTGLFSLYIIDHWLALRLTNGFVFGTNLMNLF